MDFSILTFSVFSLLFYCFPLKSDILSLCTLKIKFLNIYSHLRLDRSTICLKFWLAKLNKQRGSLEYKLVYNKSITNVGRLHTFVPSSVCMSFCADSV